MFVKFDKFNKTFVKNDIYVERKIRIKYDFKAKLKYNIKKLNKNIYYIY